MSSDSVGPTNSRCSRTIGNDNAAHIWQLLMAGQLPILAYFLIEWFPKVPRYAMCVLALQIGAALAAMAPVYFLAL
jgi:uncharacterized membrane protein HdeD (DUF308 family)